MLMTCNRLGWSILALRPRVQRVTAPTSATYAAGPDEVAGGIPFIWAQDCPEGEKCMPWANDGGGSWNATRCSPLDPNPSAVGDHGLRASDRPRLLPLR